MAFVVNFILFPAVKESVKVYKVKANFLRSVT